MMHAETANRHLTSARCSSSPARKLYYLCLAVSRLIMCEVVLAEDTGSPNRNPLPSIVPGRPMNTRRSSNTNQRGSAEGRRRRRARLDKLHTALFGRVYCFHCGKAVRIWEVDRYPLCGHLGGRYTQDNIVPSCRPCNAARGVRCGMGLCQT